MPYIHPRATAGAFPEFLPAARVLVGNERLFNVTGRGFMSPEIIKQFGVFGDRVRFFEELGTPGVKEAGSISAVLSRISDHLPS
jgi:hypothetical protein